MSGGELMPYMWTSDSTHPTQPVQNTARKYITLDLIKQHCAVYSCIRSNVDIFYSLLLVSLRSVSHNLLAVSGSHSLTPVFVDCDFCDYRLIAIF